ncbi:MAG: hypothetical protein ABSF92_00355 [Candidatus Acidiferrales bacterium]|jgi:hypothetical protein
MLSRPEFRIRLNGVYVPNIRVQRAPDGGLEIAVRDEDLGWFVIDDRQDWILEYRDETAWALLPTEMKRASTDKGWNRTTPRELIGILWSTGGIR